METTEKNRLPILYVAKTIEARNPKHEDHAYQLAYFRKAHDTEHLYIPAARLRELVDKWRDRQECLEYCRNNDVCADDLEALLKEPGE